MSVVDKNNSAPENIKFVIIALKIGALFTMSIGAAGFIFPEFVMDFLGFDKDILYIFSGGLLFISLVEYFIIPKILINANKQANK